MLLETRELSLSFGGIVAADKIDFALAQGERLAVIGANGAGKTTFINMVTGYIKPNSGAILLDGQPITGLPPRNIVQAGVARAFQLPQLFTEHTVRQCVELAVASKQGEMRAFKALSSCVLRDEVDHVLEIVDLAQRAGETCAHLPEGHRKLLDIAMALVLRPKLMIMDEPTSGVASSQKHSLMRTIMNALSERKVTAMFVEHDVDIVEEYATRVTAWISGRIAADGSPTDVLGNSEVRSAVLGH